MSEKKKTIGLVKSSCITDVIENTIYSMIEYTRFDSILEGFAI